MLTLLKRHRDSEGGFTLIELIVCVAILGIIIVPLAVALVASFTATDTIDAQLTQATSREQLAGLLGRDAASVDAAGASNVGESGPICGLWYPGQETPLVTFNSTYYSSTAGSSTKVHRATYWITGIGKQISLVRRYCNSVVPGIANQTDTPPQVITVLTNIGIPGDPRDRTTQQISAVHGLNGPGTNPCDEYSCALKVQSYQNRALSTWQVSVQRRVFGAGIPLQVGKLFSSTTQTYSQWDINGNPNGSELAWENLPSAPGKLSLAGGLDPPPSMQVDFTVQASFPGHTTYFDGSGFGANAPVQIHGAYCTSAGSPAAACTAADANTWILPLPRADFTYGGDYQVWTYLTPAGGPTKKYGGVAGFSFYIDYKPLDSVFVSATTGSDSNTGNYPATPSGGGPTDGPKATIGAGLTASRSSGRETIVVAAGTYNHEIDPNTNAVGQLTVVGERGVTLGYGPGSTCSNDGHGNYTRLGCGANNDTGYANKTIVGGYDAGKWTRVFPNSAAGGATASIIQGTTGTGVLMETDPTVNPPEHILGPTGIIFRQLTIASGSYGTDGNAYGVRMLDGSEATFENTFITAAAGRSGQAGVNGTSAGDACFGQDATTVPTFGSSNGPTSGPRIAASSKGAPAGHDDPCVNNTVTYRASGYGGNGGSPGSGGQDGGRGGGGSGAFGGSGGVAGVLGCFPAGSGKAGNGGLPASTVLDGAPAANELTGSTLGPTWTMNPSASGQDGAAGAAGGGGGGSGGGAGNACTVTAGGSGAEGGEGGLGGQPGKGGTAGGASIGVYVNGSSNYLVDPNPASEVGVPALWPKPFLSANFVQTVSTPNLGAYSNVTVGNGGNGGSGGAGGHGGNGGYGGGGSGQFTGGNTSGAGGGSGGGMGGHGSGGSGGPSIAVFTDKAVAATISNTSATLNPGLAGGAGGGGQPPAGVNCADGTYFGPGCAGGGGQGGPGSFNSYNFFFFVITFSTPAGPPGSAGPTQPNAPTGQNSLACHTYSYPNPGVGSCA